jgi:hypothetical protein
MSDLNVLPGKQRYTDKKTLFASAARIADANGDAVEFPGGMQALCVELDITAAATDNGDKLDVWIQTSLDGTNYVDVHRFTQADGDGGPLRYYATMAFGPAETEFENAAALGEHTSRGLAGVLWRARCKVTDASTDDASFTFSVTAVPM